MGAQATGPGLHKVIYNFVITFTHGIYNLNKVEFFLDSVLTFGVKLKSEKKKKNLILTFLLLMNGFDEN